MKFHLSDNSYGQKLITDSHMLRAVNVSGFTDFSSNIKNAN